jgi:hemolysin activation/secretion protein
VGNDHVRMAKLGIVYDRLDLSGRTYVSLYGFQGLGEVLGAMDNGAALTTRQGADNRFTKGTLAAGRVQSLGHDALLLLKGSGQITTGPVVVIEQMLLGGPDSVRGYQLGERFVDEGYAVTAEARVPLLPSLLSALQGAIFVDHGGGRLRNPQPGERASSSLTGTGLGIQTELPYYSMRLRADVGFPLGPKPSGGTVAGDRSPIFYLQATSRF